MAVQGVDILPYEQMPRPHGKDDFPSWLVPARNNIQREMLKLRPILLAEPYVGFPLWVLDVRGFVLGACFSLWRSVFQARESPADKMNKDGAIFLDQIIYNNAATYGTELNGWSLRYYIENAVFRIEKSRKIAISKGVDPNLLPKASMLGESDNEDKNCILRSERFTPYGEWEECFLAVRALITAMEQAITSKDT